MTTAHDRLAAIIGPTFGTVDWYARVPASDLRAALTEHAATQARLAEVEGEVARLRDATSVDPVHYHHGRAPEPWPCGATGGSWSIEMPQVSCLPCIHAHYRAARLRDIEETSALASELAGVRSLMAAHRAEVSARLGDLLDNFADESQAAHFHEHAQDCVDVDAEDCCDESVEHHETEAGRFRAQIVALAFGPDVDQSPAPAPAEPAATETE